MYYYIHKGFQGGTSGKELACQCRRHVLPLDWEKSLEEDTVTHFSILAWRIACTEEPGGLQSIGLRKVRHNFSDLAYTHAVLTGELELQHVN